MFSKIAPKVTIYFGCFCTRIWHQDLPKIVQSGHTGQRKPPKNYQKRGTFLVQFVFRFHFQSCFFNFFRHKIERHIERVLKFPFKYKIISFLTLNVVTQLAKRSLSIPAAVRGSNPVIGKVVNEHCFLPTVLSRRKIKKNSPEMASFKKEISFLTGPELKLWQQKS